ncbi:MAG TPA: carboxypeptidase regulatory-like domain-containing protein [Bryobacteraceae bacterium]|jgi:hypothetical protein
MRSTLLFLCALLLAATALAQTDRGSITGTIADPAGAVVPNAKIEVKNTASGAVFSGGTSSTGNFIVANLPAGTYSLAVTADGFKKYVRENLNVTVATDTRQDVSLQVGAPTEVITVTEAAPLLKTESGEVSHTVTAEQADNLPILTLSGSSNPFSNGFGNIRDPLAVTQLLPGVQFGNDYALRVNGLPSASEAIRIEGQDATNGMWREVTQINQSGMDAIQEVSVQTSNFAAEFGQAAGGYFNFTMKSGTNSFHGSAYDYLVNEAFNAGLPFTDAGTTNSLKAGQHIRNPVRRNDYGFTIGGPVSIPKVYDGHDKTFFFFNFEQYRENRTTASSVLTVPTLAYRQGDFSQATAGLGNLTQNGAPAVDSLGRALPQNGVYDPNTTRPGPDGALVRDLFPNGQIPLTRLDPVSAAIQKLLPQPANGLTQNNYPLPAFSDFQHTTNFSFKIDHSLSSTIKISGYLSRILTRNPNNNGISGNISQPAPTDNRSTTARINYDQTLKPTLLLHLGIGYLYTYSPSIAPAFDESTLGLKGFYNESLFPNITGLVSGSNGGVNLSSSPFGGGGALGPGGFAQNLWDQKPTANGNLTWVKGNHTYKFGGELVIEGFPDNSLYRSNGLFGFAASETGNPWENNRGLNSTTGFNYASFFLGQIDNLQISPPTQTKLGNHSMGFFAQDSWKVNRKLTVDYGIRYDYATYLKEQYGRMQSGSFNTLNPTVGRLGAVIYEGYGGGRCNCAFSHNYPYAWGPRLGFAYQINTKTVLRAGTGIQYATTANNAFLSYNVADFYSFNGPGYGLPVSALAQGNPYAAGNPFGNPVITWPNFDNGKYPTKTINGLVPQSPFISIDRSSRPPRVLTWSIGLQREVLRNLVIEAAYVGNRGAWFTAPELNSTNYNSLQISDLTRNHLDIANANDRALLSLPIGSPTAIQRGFGGLPYTGFPTSQTVGQSLRPVPQWDGVPPFLGPPLGDTWYDSLQMKATKRYSHGLEMQGSFTWEKNTVLGTSADTQYFTPATPLINDVFNREQNKQLSGLGRPLSMVISGTYTTPRPAFTQNKIVSNVLRGWQIGAVLRYQSGALIQTPPSSNNLLSQLQRGPENNPATWGGGHTYWNVVPGQNPLLVDPNSKFDPTTQLVLNPAAWTDAAAGQFGTSAPYYNSYRWQRQPSEAMNFGRLFRMGKEGKYNLQIRADFQNIFNRLFYSAPATGGFFGTNPSTFPFQLGGQYYGGYGFVNWISGGSAQPRSGQLVARFTF